MEIINELNQEINLHRQLVSGNKYQVISFENIIKVFQKIITEQNDKIKTLEDTIKNKPEEV